MTFENRTPPSNLIQWLTLIAAICGAAAAVWNSWVANDLQRTNQIYQEMTQALAALQVSGNDDMTAKVKYWGQIVLDRRLADEQGKDEFKKWAEIAGQQSAVIDMLSQFCYKPDERLVTQAEPIPELVPDRKDGAATGLAAAKYVLTLKLAYKKLVISHDALVESLKRHCSATEDLGKKLKSLQLEMP